VTLALAWGALTGAVQWATVLADHGVPNGDACGHLLRATQMHRFLFRDAPWSHDAYPPLVHLVSGLGLEWVSWSFDGALVSVVLFSALLGAGLAVLGLWIQGKTAACLLPWLALGSPLLRLYGHDLILDVPGVALLPWALVALMASRGFARLGPTLAFGVALAGLTLTRQTGPLWLLPAVLGSGLLLLRHPSALLSLAAVSVPLVWIFQVLWARRLGPWPNPEWMFTPMGLLKIGLAVSLTAVVLWACLSRWRGTFVDGLRRGLALGASASLCLALLAPWLLVEADTLYSRGRKELVDEVFKIAQAPALDLVRFQLQTNGPGIEWLWAAGLVSSGLGVFAWWFRPAVRSRLPANTPRAALAIWVSLGSAAFGVYVTVQFLSPDPRYMLGAHVLGFVALGTFATWGRGLRRTLTPLLVAFAGLQLAGSFVETPGLDVGPVVQKPPPRLAHASPYRLYHAGIPETRPVEVEFYAVLDEVRLLLRSRNAPSRSIAYVSSMGKGWEAQSIVAVGALLYFPEEFWVRLPRDPGKELDELVGVVVMGLSGIQLKQLEASLEENTGSAPKPLIVTPLGLRLYELGG
jgi:hypothetical protein